MKFQFINLIIVFGVSFHIYPLLFCDAQQTNQQCVLAHNCSMCIQIPNCGWCKQPDFNEFGTVRCLDMFRLEHLKCDSKHLLFPVNQIKYKDKTSDNFSDGQSSSFDMDQLIYPQKIKIKLRPNTEARFKITFKQPDKYPVDIYYLMDVTWSMKDHLESLVKLADKLVDSMSNITTNFRLGFGSFIDKVTMPYSNTLPQKLANPCKESFACIPAYGFRNHLSLTKDFSLFLNEVKKVRLSGNLDNAEGGFDAIMQVISCKNEINWQKRARKIILFATDGIFHYAGDGKLGGIIKPNDGKCHLDDKGFYTESLTQDYPTLYQINDAILNNQINVIFSVPKSAFRVYEELSKNLIGAVTGELAENSNNIVELINENYKKIVFKVELQDTSSTNVELKYFTKCLNSEGKMEESKVCNNVGPGKPVTFELSALMKSCDHYSKHQNNRENIIEKFVIFPVGIEQYVEVELELMCKCDCEKEIEVSSKKCSYNGDFICGKCHCKKNYVGDKCQCSDDDSNRSIDKMKCLRHGKICSGRGLCDCGECKCDRKKGNFKNEIDQLIFGKHCEFDTFSCPTGANGLICSGNGYCVDGQCDCNAGWKGDICDCSTDEKRCVHPLTDKICSGNGECVCGKCKCNRPSNSSRHIYSGRFCSECLNCGDECIEHDACVACKVFNSGPLRDNCDENCKFEIQTVHKLDNISSLLVGSRDVHFERKQCIMIDEYNCQYSFIYEFDVRDGAKRVEAIPEKICMKSVIIFQIVSLIVLAVLLIGIIVLLVWKVVTYHQDRKAYQQWLEYLQNRQLTAEGKNPLYQAPNTKYKNPLYKSSEM